MKKIIILTTAIFLCLGLTLKAQERVEAPVLVQILPSNGDGVMDFSKSFSWNFSQIGISDTKGNLIAVFDESGLRSLDHLISILKSDPSIEKVTFDKSSNLLIVSIHGVSGDKLEGALVSRIPEASLKISAAEGGKKIDGNSLDQAPEQGKIDIK